MVVILHMKILKFRKLLFMEGKYAYLLVKKAKKTPKLVKSNAINKKRKNLKKLNAPINGIKTELEDDENIEGQKDSVHEEKESLTYGICNINFINKEYLKNH